jgi:trigger factor
MSKVVREDTDALHVSLTVTIEKADYLLDYESELDKFRKQGHVKGFRKGKTPAAMVRRLYGPSLLANIIENQVKEALSNYFKDNDINFLGQPLPSETQEKLDFNALSPGDYSFRFDLGLAPEFELQGLGEGAGWKYREMEVSEEAVEEQWQAILKQHGQHTDVESDFRESDNFLLQVHELDGDAPAPQGLESSFFIRGTNIADEQVKAQLLAARLEDTIQLSLLGLHEDMNEASVRAQWLKLDKEDERPTPARFEATLVKVKRYQMPEVNQELFDNIFGPGAVSSEEEAKTAIREGLRRENEPLSRFMFLEEVKQELLRQNDFELPEAFLKRWLDAQRENPEEEKEEEEEEYALSNFLEELRWNLIKQKIIRRFNLEVTDEDIVHGLFNRAYSNPYVSTLGDDFVRQMVDKMAQDQATVERTATEVMKQKIIDAVREATNPERLILSGDAFREYWESIKESTS